MLRLINKIFFGEPEKTPSVNELVGEFTGKFQEVVNTNSNVVEVQDVIIEIATARKEEAEKEVFKAQNFINNFNKMVG